MTYSILPVQIFSDDEGTWFARFASVEGIRCDNEGKRYSLLPPQMTMGDSPEKATESLIRKTVLVLPGCRYGTRSLPTGTHFRKLCDDWYEIFLPQDE